MTKSTNEHNLETIIVSHLRDVNGYTEGTSAMYSRDWAVVKEWLEAFLSATQPDKVKTTNCFLTQGEKDRFYFRLDQELAKRGVTDILRKGFKFNGETFDLYYPTPSKNNPSAAAAYAANNFGVIRQLKYSKDNENAIDFAVFMNGIPLATFELKNSLTNQTVQNAIAQYKQDRDPKEKLLKPKRCAVHFAVDDSDVFMCTELKGGESWFLPFNRGVNGGAGNPVIPGKTKTSYLWEEVFTKDSLSNIIENFAQIIREKDKKTGKEKEKIIWPRYHQLDAVRRILATTYDSDVGRRFLIQHSAGSGKSNTITWLAYQLVLLHNTAGTAKFDSIIVVTDRVNLDHQIRDNINAFARLHDLVGWADSSDGLHGLLAGGKKIIVTTIHKFGYILDQIGSALKSKKFAVIIDEAHSSQSGAMSSDLAITLSGNAAKEGEPEDVEDVVYRLIQGRKLAKNANYYAFTATPKNKTLEMFGERVEMPGAGIGFEPFHEYTMKQAIEEGFILDVLRNYTPYKSYYKVMKAVEDDPKFDKERAKKKIRAFVEKQPSTIDAKAKIIVEHFCTKVYTKIGGKARAMVVTSSIERAIQFFNRISALLQERGGKFKAIVAFTDKDIGGEVVTESSLNHFPSSEIETRIEEDPYRILVVAEKYQTGYDQPLLHTMYVDKPLADLKAVQTLSRLNRCHPKKTDTFVLDFANEPDEIQKAFQKFYKTTVQSGESDVNKLNDLIGEIEEFPFYAETDCDGVVNLLLTGGPEDRPQIDSILDCDADRFRKELNEDQQIHAKSAMKNYCRIYPFFASIMPYASAEWEKRFLFYSLLVRKLPKLTQEDLTEGLIEAIDFEKYRIQKEDERNILLQDSDAEVNPVPVDQGGGKHTPELDQLSNIVKDFNDLFGGIDWRDADEVRRQIRELPQRLEKNENFVNVMRNGDSQTAQIQFNEIMQTVIADMGEAKIEFMQHYFNNPEFRKFVNERVFRSCRDSIGKRENGATPPMGGWHLSSEEAPASMLRAADEEE